jgi:hypothetical protein
MIHKRESCGHLPRPIGAPWNRSSAFSPEVLATLNTATNMAVQNAIQIFEREIDNASLSAEQYAEAIQMLAQGAADGIAEFAESLKK